MYCIAREEFRRVEPQYNRKMIDAMLLNNSVHTAYSESTSACWFFGRNGSWTTLFYFLFAPALLSQYFFERSISDICTVIYR
jgi:hypothetical protein